MRRVIVTYRVREERLAEHERLLREVYAELAADRPEGVRYSAYREADGLQFTHIASLADGRRLTDFASWRRWNEGCQSRLESPALVTVVEEIGSY